MRAVRGIFSVILSFLILLSAFVTLGTAVVKYRIADVDYYVESIITDEYVEALRKDVYSNVTIICENLEVDRDTVMSFVDNSALRSISQSHFRTVYTSLFNGSPLEYERFENEALKTKIYNELEAFANEMNIVGEDISAATEETYNYILDDINETLTYFTQENMNMVSFVSKITGLGFATNNAFYIAIAVLVVLCALKLLAMGKRRLLSFAYNTSFMLWLASACWFIPVTVIKLENITLNLAIAYSGFKVYLRNVINSVIGGFFDVTLVAIIVTTALLIASIIVILISLGKKKKTPDNNSVEQVAQEN